MNIHSCLLAIVILVSVGIGPRQSEGMIMPLGFPADLARSVTIDFEGYPDYTVANTLFRSQGLTFTRDDGSSVYVLDWTALGRSTASPDNVLATVRNGADPSSLIWATHLNVIATEPLVAMGAYFGNDQSDPDFSVIRMSAFGVSGSLVGFVEMVANGNTDVDQFVGLRSTVPFVRVRFDNLTMSGAESAFFSVVLDDLVFTRVPEPSLYALIPSGLAALIVLARRRRWT